MVAGGAPAGIYTTCSPEEVAYIVGHSEAAIVLVEDHPQYLKLKETRGELPGLKHIVLMDGHPPVADDPMVLTWQAFLDAGAAIADPTVDERLNGITPDRTATYIYTSGTTGPPKAVELSHGNLAWTATTACSIAALEASDSSVSYLPLSHIAEQMFTLHAPATVGYPVYYAESIQRVPDNLQSVQPTVVFGVPRIWEKMHAKVSSRLAEATGVKKRLADFALRTGATVTDVRNHGQVPSGLLALKYRLASSLIYSKVKPLMGLSRARLCVSGAAPISREVLDFFAGLDIPIYEVYGQSEDCGPTSFNLPGQTRLGTVGRPLPDTEVRIADDGEILVRGPHVFKGYYKDPEATAETLIDGWLHTGDLGAFDDEGYLVITGRKKDIIITAGGKNIAPKNIEAALTDLPLVSQAVVIGDRRKFLSALITLDPEAVEAFRTQTGFEGAAHTSATVREALQKGVDERVNPRFAQVEHVRKFTVLDRELSIEAGELTPTLKIKRRIVNEHFADTIDAMYQD
jgi:long-chain acyl-CoA synthetase